MAFDMRGRTEIIQSNGARVILEEVDILGDRLVGGAFTGDGDSRTAGFITNGHITGQTVDFDVQWTHARGHYHGELDGARKLSGSTFNVHNPSQQATWVSTRPF